MSAPPPSSKTGARVARGPLGTVVLAVLLAAAVLSAVPVSGAAAPSPSSPESGSPVASPPAVPTPVPTGPNGTVPAGRIVELYPNPLADGDRGEYVVVVLPRRGNWSLSDGESTVGLPDRRGRVLVTDAPGGGRHDLEADAIVRGEMALANAGERLTLRLDGTLVDELAYGRAPEGERFVRDAADPWRHPFYDPREVVSTGGASARAFLLPDSPSVVYETLAAADRRLFLAGYTLTDQRVVDLLVAARDRGVDVRVLLDADPVGGTTAAQVRALDRLAAAGVGVSVLGGPGARFRFHHAKYAVVDDEALVLTENWKPAGVGGRSSRGWGLLVRSAETAGALSELFLADSESPDVRGWRAVRGTVDPVRSRPANGSYRERTAPGEVDLRTVRLLTAPGNAGEAVVAELDGASRRVLVVQPTVDVDGRLFGALMRAAGRGVRVRLLLSGAWYVSEENAAIVRRVGGAADRRGLDLEARIATPAGRFEKVHAKGLVVDDTVVVGSMNWNPTSVGENREVLLAVEGAGVAEYFAESFAADWRAGRGGWRDLDVPPLAALALVAAAAAAVIYARRRVGFAPGPLWGEGVEEPDRERE